MWSKNKSCSRISNIIEAYCPNNSNTIVELFTGWFAVWEVFLNKWYTVIANDKNKYVIALLDTVINKALDIDKCLERVSREKFKDVITNPSKYEDWYVWYVMCIWSFGNNQQGYLFWDDMEAQKSSLFDLVVNKRADGFVKSIMPQKYIDWIIKQKDRHMRRMALKKVIRAIWKYRLQSLERLESLESLERLERLGKLSNVVFTSKSYEEVEIPKDAIVYCDPPYKGTATYREWWFDHEKFREYVRKLSKTNKVFVSEYTAPDDFTCVYEFSQKSLLSSKWTQSHNNQPNEKLFIYK